MKKNQYGLVGKNIHYSFSREYFRLKFQKLKDTESSYENFDIQNIAELSNILRNTPCLRGLNVTVPYKEVIIPYLDKLSEKAAQIGAVNTIKISKKGQLKGYNTDWYGFYHALKPMLKSHHKKALILGTGGASKAVEYALKKLEMHYQFVSRANQKDILTYDQIDRAIMEDYTVIVNATPLGTFPKVEDKPDLPYSCFSSRHIAFDLIYNPETTSFLKTASERGASIQNGLKMLELQAEKAWKIWNKSRFMPNLTHE